MVVSFIPISFIFLKRIPCDTVQKAFLKSVKNDHIMDPGLLLNYFFLFLRFSQNLRMFTSHPIYFLNPVYWLFRIY